MRNFNKLKIVASTNWQEGWKSEQASMRSKKRLKTSQKKNKSLQVGSPVYRVRSCVCVRVPRVCLCVGVRVCTCVCACAYVCLRAQQTANDLLQEQLTTANTRKVGLSLI